MMMEGTRGRALITSQLLCFIKFVYAYMQLNCVMEPMHRGGSTLAIHTSVLAGW